MNEKFVERAADEQVRRDLRILADFTAIWCKGNHSHLERSAAATEAAELGVYGSKVPMLCEECTAHLAYAEKRRMYCPKDPKPFCAHCDTQCYKSDEQVWQRNMMRYAGPRSWYQGHLLDGLKHAAASRAHARQLEK